MFMFVRSRHLQHILNPLLYKKYCKGMYSIMYILHIIYHYILINIEEQTNEFVKQN
jgi:hypothetical protein